MGEFQLILSEKFGSEESASIANHLREYVTVDGPYSYFRKSDENLPQFIRLIASKAVWQAAFGIFASAYLAHLGYKLADVTVDKAQEYFHSEDIRPLAETSTLLSEVKKETGADCTIQVGIKFDGRTDPVMLVISEDDPAKIACAIALFVEQSDKISDAMKSDPTSKKMVGLEAHAEILEDGALKVWWHYREDNGETGTREVEVR